MDGGNSALLATFSFFVCATLETITPVSRPAILVLADGTCFDGIAIGIDGLSVGEVVFNTAMTGYQEILSDPSYAKQIVTLTYPHIGSTGANSEDMESASVHCAGLVIRDLPRLHSNFRSSQCLGEFLRDNRVVAISDIDTRALTRHLREHGAQNGCIMAGSNISETAALQAAKDFPGLAGMDLAKQVTCAEPYTWSAGSWSLNPDEITALEPTEAKYHIVAMDFGVKHNILRLFADRGCKVTVVPATYTADQILALKPDGLFLSNGPGDPEPCDYAIAAIRELLATQLPTFGICLGHQLLALASDAQTMKMKFGHHGANHPVLDTASGKVMISSQNHGFAVDPDSLNDTLAITHVSLFQGHPEASPGPHDVEELFDQFMKLLPAA